MGDVYEAEDRQLLRRVAVKVFRAAAPSDRGRFDAEAVTLASLNHPGLVKVFDVGAQDGDAFVVLELVEGPTLAARLEDRGPMPPVEVADLGAQLADALAHVHARGVVHRDVTPSNVLCGPDGRVRLADFGIVRLVDTTRITAPATTLGTAAYMAPEQLQSGDVTAAADIYSLGLVLLELLTARRAFTGLPHEMATARLTRSPNIPSRVPGPWRDLLRSMTDRTPSRRPSAGEVRDRLRTVAVDAMTTESVVPPLGVVVEGPAGSAVSGDAVTTTISEPDGTSVMPVELMPQEGFHPRTRRRSVWGAAAAGVLLLGGIAMASGDRGPQEKTPPTTASTTPVVTTTELPSTTQPPAPPEPSRSEGRGKGNGKGKSGR